MNALWAVVPVKSFERAKQRLDAVLTPEERVGLACAMLEDVLAALVRASALAGTAVVTGDPRAARIAQTFGAGVIADPDETGMGIAATTAAQGLADVGASGILIVPGDVPLMTVAEVDAIARTHGPGPAVTLVPAASDAGTNALACSPADVIPFRFGENSFARHWRAARTHGIRPRSLALPGLARDIDRPEDLRAFAARPSSTRAYSYLENSGLAARLHSTADAGEPKARISCRAG